MFATLESVRIYDAAENLGKMIAESELAKEYRQCLYKMKTDKKSQEKISRFVRLKERYEEIQRFGRYHPDYQKIMK